MREIMPGVFIPTLDSEPVVPENRIGALERTLKSHGLKLGKPQIMTSASGFQAYARSLYQTGVRRVLGPIGWYDPATGRFVFDGGAFGDNTQALTNLQAAVRSYNKTSDQELKVDEFYY